MNASKNKSDEAARSNPRPQRIRFTDKQGQLLEATYAPGTIVIFQIPDSPSSEDGKSSLPVAPPSRFLTPQAGKKGI